MELSLSHTRSLGTAQGALLWPVLAERRNQYEEETANMGAGGMRERNSLEIELELSRWKCSYNKNKK